MENQSGLKNLLSVERSTKFQYLAIFIVVGLLYGLSLTFDFVLDDKIVITENAFVQKGFGGLKEIFTTEGFEGYFKEKRDLVVGARYRPLSLAMFAIENALVGNNPWLGHLINLLLYAFLGIVLLQWAKFNFEIKGKNAWFLSLPFLIALLYILHPIHIEAVANIKGRDEILAMLLSMMTLLLAQKYAKDKSWLLLLGTGLMMFFALLAKENSISFVFVIPFTLVWISRIKFSDVLKVSVVLILATVAYLAMRNNAVGYLIPNTTASNSGLMNNPFVDMDSSEKWATIIYTMGKYLQLLVFPYPLTHDYYPYHIPKSSWQDAFVVFTVVVSLVLTAIALLTARKKKWGLWALMFFLATICLVSNAFFTVGTFMNERFVFMPSLAFIILLALGLNKLINHEKLSKLGIVALGIIILGYGLQNFLRIPDWKDGFVLNQSAIKVSKNSARINLFMATDYFNLAVASPDRAERNRLLQEAKKLLERAKNIYPLYTSANNMLCGVCAEQFKDDNNIKDLLKCFKGVATDRPDTEYLNQFLEYLVKRGDFIIELAMYYEDTGYENLYQKKNNFPQAIRYLREAEELNPGSRPLFEKLSSVYLAFGYHLQDYPDPKYKAAEMIESGRYYGNKAVQ